MYSTTPFDELTSRITIPALTLDAIERVTALSWKRIETPADLTTASGVYGWFGRNSGSDDLVLVYHGSGSGANGLFGRLNRELQFRAKHAARADRIEESEVSLYEWLAESPAIRHFAEIIAGDRPLELYAAEAEAATWTVESGLLPPESATEWEIFLGELSHLAAARRSVLGGGAWEIKQNRYQWHAASVAFDRVRDVARGK